ncbi:MAG: 50S ribosomal protein L17 [Kiritimatiellae bacterium]|nr:50S ribosomal protein L17 [Kiritimatiellia bacterium]
MRHRKTTIKLGRTTAHRNALLASLVCSLILHGRIRTTLAKAKAARRLAERSVTWGRAGTLAARRRALAVLRQKRAVSRLFKEIAPAMSDRNGGYTRITRLPGRRRDSSTMAVLEWVRPIGEAAREASAATAG